MDNGQSHIETNEGMHPSFISPTPTGEGNDHFDVFLSFRGSDTRKEFADHLYHSLDGAGIVPGFVFRDDKSIPIGEEFSPWILDAIARSKISILIISKNYASSKWCLRELIHIMDHAKSTSHVVLPIFYKVDPSDVRHLKGSFGEAFHSRKKYFDEEDIQKGQQALKEVSYLHGWESEKVANGHEGELVKKIIENVWSKLQQDFQLDVTKCLVGIDDHVNRIMNWVHTPTTNARMIGIYGMGGIGKTTLAKVIYNRLLKDFVHHSFLADIRETACRKNIAYLQKQLIKDILPTEPKFSNVDGRINWIKSGCRGKKVLILLDDIDREDQLNALAGGCNWFMAGSIIIVTTRYEAVLDQSEFKVDKYDLNGLAQEHALLLFNRHAFHMNHSTTDFEGLSRNIVSTMGGLPLALKVVGSYLYKKTNRKVWEDVWKQLKNQPHKDVQKILQISYDALEDEHKQIFLDIVCFFIGVHGDGESARFAIYMWEDLGFSPNQGIEELKLRCLIKVGDHGEFMVHDQLRDLGRSIFCRGQLLEKCNGPWDDDYEGVPRVQRHLERLFSLFHDFLGAAPSKDSMERFSEVRWLQWMVRACDLSLLTIDLHLPNLSVLQLSGDGITEDWQGWISFMVSKWLKVLLLQECRNLRCTPDLSAFIQLKILILRGCKKLEHLHPSIGKLTSLVSLDLCFCRSLKELPEEVGELKDLEELLLDDSGIIKIPTSIGSLRKLKKLSANCCKSLREIPSSIGDLQNLQHLHLNTYVIEELPSAIGSLRKLKKPSAMSCKSLREIPNSIGDLRNLQHLDSGAGIEKLPSAVVSLEHLRNPDIFDWLSISNPDFFDWLFNTSEIGDLPSPEDLYLDGTPISDLLESVRNLSSLQRLDLRGYKELRSLPELPSSLQHLNLSCCYELRSLPELPSSLQHLNLNCCYELQLLPELPSSLQSLQLWDCKELQMLPELPSGLTNLSVTCQSLGLPQLLHLIHLEKLDLEVRHLLEDIHEFSSITSKLCFEEWDKLTSLSLSGHMHLEELSIKKCSSIERLKLSQLIHLKRLRIEHCDSLVEIEGCDNLESLEVIFLDECKCLKKFKASGCGNLVEIQGLDGVKSLEELDFTGCKSMETLPDLIGFEKLRSLIVRDCEKLAQLRGLEMSNLTYLDISGCDSLEAIPSLFGTDININYEQHPWFIF